MAAAAFSIRDYAASMRGEVAAELLRPFQIKDLPAMEAPRFRWWANELASAVAAAAAASPRKSPGKAKPPMERSISDLFAAAPPMAVPQAGGSGSDQRPEVDDDEALCAIERRTREKKMKRKRRMQDEEEEEDAAATAAESSGARDDEWNFATRMRKALKDTASSAPQLKASFGNTTSEGELCLGGTFANSPKSSQAPTSAIPGINQIDQLKTRLNELDKVVPTSRDQLSKIASNLPPGHGLNEQVVQEAHSLDLGVIESLRRSTKYLHDAFVKLWQAQRIKL